MKNTIIFAIILSSVFVSQGIGQDRIEATQTASNKSQGNDYHHALGMSVGWSIGYGITYQYWIKNFGIQANFAPIVDERSKQLTGGLTVFYKLVSVEHLSLFLYQGNSYWYSSSESYGGEQNVKKYFNHGIGLGIEFLAFHRVSLSFMGGYAALNNFSSLSLTGETALVFRF